MVPLLATRLLVLLLGAPLLATAVAAGEAGSQAAPLPAPSREKGAPKTSEQSCLDRSIDALQARYEKVHDLSARFTQTTRAAHLGAVAPAPVTSRGHMVVAKPAKMRWVYEEPEKSLVVSDGKSLWIYDPADGEAQRLPVGEGFLSGAAVQFLLGRGDLRRDFQIRLVRCDEQQVELELVPREPATYEKLRVVADRHTGTVLRTEVDDLLGNVTVVELSQIETNQDPPPETFRFHAPKGVSVIELKAPATGRPPGTGSGERPRSTQTR